MKMIKQKDGKDRRISHQGELDWRVHCMEYKAQQGWI